MGFNLKLVPNHLPHMSKTYNSIHSKSQGQYSSRNRLTSRRVHWFQRAFDFSSHFLTVQTGKTGRIAVSDVFAHPTNCDGHSTLSGAGRAWKNSISSELEKRREGAKKFKFSDHMFRIPLLLWLVIYFSPCFSLSLNPFMTMSDDTDSWDVSYVHTSCTTWNWKQPFSGPFRFHFLDFRHSF